MKNYLFHVIIVLVTTLPASLIFVNVFNIENKLAILALVVMLIVIVDFALGWFTGASVFSKNDTFAPVEDK